jgi:hypothetical protein
MRLVSRLWLAFAQSIAHGAHEDARGLGLRTLRSLRVVKRDE